MDSLDDLKTQLKQFGHERDWEQFHSPKNLAMALAGEAGELIECFQWLTEEQSQNLSDKQKAAVCEELADVQLYLILLANKLNIDLIAEAQKKIAVNAARYPIEKVKGKPNKYTDYN